MQTAALATALAAAQTEEEVAALLGGHAADLTAQRDAAIAGLEQALEHHRGIMVYPGFGGELEGFERHKQELEAQLAAAKGE